MPNVRLAQRLPCALSGHRSAFFCNSGTEATEAALKPVRRHFLRPGSDRECPGDRRSTTRFMAGRSGRLSLTGQARCKGGFGPVGGVTTSSETSRPRRGPGWGSTSAAHHQPDSGRGRHPHRARRLPRRPATPATESGACFRSWTKSDRDGSPQAKVLQPGRGRCGGRGHHWPRPSVAAFPSAPCCAHKRAARCAGIASGLREVVRPSGGVIHS